MCRFVVSRTWQNRGGRQTILWETVQNTFTRHLKQPRGWSDHSLRNSAKHIYQTFEAVFWTFRLRWADRNWVYCYQSVEQVFRKTWLKWAHSAIGLECTAFTLSARIGKTNETSFCPLKIRIDLIDTVKCLILHCSSHTKIIKFQLQDCRIDDLAQHPSKCSISTMRLMW